jgi:hypothetical protein
MSALLNDWIVIYIYIYIYIYVWYVSALGKDILPAVQTALEMETLNGIPQHLWNLICAVSGTKTFYLRSIL